jgi:hypothetical protein
MFAAHGDNARTALDGTCKRLISSAVSRGVPMDSWPVVITAAAFATVIIAYGFLFAV